jgi:uncharacterized protein YebE (UPF0316 family)
MDEKKQLTQMKSKNVLVASSIVFLLLAVILSVIVWSDVPTSAKIAFFAFGYGAGITTGAWVARRQI